MTNKTERLTANSTYPKGGVSCSKDSFVVNQTLVSQIKFCGKRPALRVAANRYRQAILAGLGCSVMPIIGLRKELANGELKIVKVPELPKITQWRLIWPAGKKHSAVSQAYLNFVEKEKIILLLRFLVGAQPTKYCAAWHIPIYSCPHSHSHLSYA